MTRLFFDALSLDGHPSGTRTRLVRLVPALLERGHEVTVAHRPELDGGARRALAGARLLEVRRPPRHPLARIVAQPSLYRRFVASERPDVVMAETWPMPSCPGLIATVHDLRYLQLRPHLRLPFGPAEIVDYGRYGLVVERNRADLLGEAILRALPGGEDHDRLSAGAGARAAGYAAPLMSRRLHDFIAGLA